MGLAGFGVGLPLLEQQFDLPPEPIAVAEVLDAEVGPLEVGDQVPRAIQKSRKTTSNSRAKIGKEKVSILARSDSI